MNSTVHGMLADVQHGEIKLRDGTQYPYTVRVSNRARRLSVHVDMDGAVEAVVPRGVAHRHGHALIVQKRDWIERTLVRNTRKRARSPHISLKHGSQLTCLGTSYLIHAEPDETRMRTSAQTRGRTLVIYTPREDDTPKIVERWLREQMRTYAWQRGPAMAALIERELQSVRITGARTRWGSCNPKLEQISLNWKLALAPEPVAHYVLAHEIAHLRISGHSKTFWKLVAYLHPEHKTHKRWLREYGHGLKLE